MPNAGFDKDGNAKLIAKYENNLGSCPSPDTRYVGVTKEQVVSVTKTQYGPCETASLNNYYNFDDIRSVHLDKAPWNDFFFFSKCQNTPLQMIYPMCKYLTHPVHIDMYTSDSTRFGCSVLWFRLPRGSRDDNYDCWRSCIPTKPRFTCDAILKTESICAN